MRRPAVVCSAAFGAGILLTYVLDICLAVLVLTLTVLLIFMIILHLYCAEVLLKKYCIVMCVVALGGMIFGLSEQESDYLISKNDRPVTISGIVMEADIKDDSCNIVLKSESFRRLVKYYGDCSRLKTCVGKSIEVYGTVELPRKRSNPGCFDYRLYLKACDIDTVIMAENIKVIDGKDAACIKLIGIIRNTFYEKMKKHVDEYKQGLIMAIIFGDKTMLDEDLYSDFQKNGTAHVLAVSGLHTGIIYAFFVFIWRGRKGPVFYMTISLLLFFYMALADFSPSVVRAACMIFLHLVSVIMKCRYDLLTSAGIVFVIMLLLNPYQLFHTGFQLSFLAVVSLAMIIPFVKRFYQGMFLSAIAIQAGMVPYTAFVFNYISLGAVLVNIPVIFLSGIILPAGVCALFSMSLSDWMFGLFIKMMDICCEVMITVNDLFYASGRTSFDVVSPPIWLLIVYYGALFFFVSETGQLMLMRRQLKKVTLTAAGICIAAIMSIAVVAEPFDDAGIVFVDVGQGDCIHIKTDSGKNYLIDGGGDADYDVGRKVLKPYLLKNGVRKIDAAFVTHLHEDHYDGVKALATEGMIKMTGVFKANMQMEEKLKSELKSEIFYLRRGDCINLDEDISIEVVSPEGTSESDYEKLLENEDNENALSLIMKVNYKGITLLVTGDIDYDGESELVRKYGSELRCDVMKVPHHGSKYSSSEIFVEAVAPKLAVFQVGRNNYGHPSEDAMDRYRDRGCRIVRNDRHGAVGLIIDGSRTFKVINMHN